MNKTLLKSWILILFAWVIPSMVSAEPMDSLLLKEDNVENYNSNLAKSLNSSFDNIDLSELESYINGYLSSNKDLQSLVTMDVEDDGLEAEVKAKEEAYKGNPQVEKANAVYEKIMGEGKLLDKLTGESLLELPIGLAYEVGSSRVVLMLNRIKFGATSATIEAFCGVEMKDGRRLLFGTDNLQYTSTGGFVGDVRLGLFSDFPMFQKSKNIVLTLKGIDNGEGRGTYVELDCNGFKGMRVEAELELSRKWVLPCDANGTVTDGRVKSSFAIEASDLNDFVVEITLPSFTPTKAKEKVVFNIEGAVFDHSDTRNAAGFVVPSGYSSGRGDSSGEQNQLAELGSSVPESNMQMSENVGSELVQSRASIPQAEQVPPEGNTTDGPEAEIEVDEEPVRESSDTDVLWRGVYIKSLDIILPKAFKREENERLSVGAEDLYVDNQGVSGNFKIGNVIPYEEGKMQKWKFSVDELSLKIVKNYPVQFAFDGRISIPITDESTPFKYAGMGNLQKDIYNFKLELAEDTNFPVWKTTRVNLHAGSYLKVESNQGEFDGEAVLHGSLGINAAHGEKQDTSRKTFAVDSVTFRAVTIVTRAPYLLLGTGGFVRFDMNPEMNGSPIAIREAAVTQRADQPGKLYLGLKMDVSFTDEKDGGSKASGGFALIGRMDDSGGTQKWKFDGIEINSVCVTIDMGTAGYVSGCVEAYNNDNTYGTGYRGMLDGGFMKTGENNYKLALQAEFIAGTKDEMKFWYFSGYVAMGSWSVPLIPGVLNINGFGGGAYYHMNMQNPPDPDMMLMQGTATPPRFTYVPDASIVFGFKASLGLVSSGNSFVANVTLEMKFNKSGLEEVMILGVGEFFQAEGSQNKITAAVALTFNFGDGFWMHGAFAVNFAVSDIITGSGNVDILKRDGDWHIYVGGYSDGSVTNTFGKEILPVTASITLGSGLEINASAYFMTGNDIPGPPPLNPQAADFFKVSTNQPRKMEGEILRGTGFAFGASANFNSRAEKAECKYIDFSVGAGFDFSLLKYGDNARCSGAPSVSPQGINGWRATGALYAYAKFSGKWKILWRCKNLPSFNAGLLLQMDVPKPSYFQARVKFKILRINVDVSAKVGNECGSLVGG